MGKQHNNTDDQEIDLSEIKRKMGSAIDGFNRKLFLLLQFFIRNIIVLSILLVLGVGLGIYLDKTQKTYNHQIIVTPNFGSVDYLYEKVDLIQSKIKENDTAFLKAIGISEPKKLVKIEIEPIIDAYPFANRSETNFEMLKVMAESSDIKEVVQEPTTSKNYPRHLIRFSTKKSTNKEKTVAPLLEYLNNSNFFSLIQREYVNNVKLKMQANERTIAQINDVLDAYAKSSMGSTGSSMVYYNNENTQLNDVIETKDKLVREQGEHRIDLVSLDKIVKDNSVILNIQNTKSVNGKLKLALPLLFMAIFIAIRLFMAFYKKQSLKIKHT